MKSLLNLLLAGLILALAGCGKTAPPAASRSAEAQALAAQHQMMPHILAAGPFDLMMFARAQTKSDLAIIYLEGDGLGWVNKNRLSDDPTPHLHTLLNLALSDTRPGVFYLARPCQYVGGISARNCDSSLWDAARYGERVLTSMMIAVDQIKKESGASKIAFVGHSGGGVIALLLAASRKDVSWVVTVASPVDIDAFTSMHHISSLDQSINPVSRAAALASIPQTLYFGADDEGVPASVGRSYMNALPDRHCAKLIVIRGADHNQGWQDQWPSIVSTVPQCEPDK